MDAALYKLVEVLEVPASDKELLLRRCEEEMIDSETLVELGEEDLKVRPRLACVVCLCGHVRWRAGAGLCNGTEEAAHEATARLRL